MINDRKVENKRMIERGKEFVLDILFPIECVGCGKEGKYICDDCNLFVSENSQICPVCQTSSFSGKTHKECEGKYELDGLVSIWEYESLIKKVIGEIKYRGFFHSLKELTEKSFKIMVKDEARFLDFLKFLLDRNTLITYVPIFKTKELKRGFNQSQILAKEIGKMINKKEICLLKKIKNTESQTGLNKQERTENVKGAFDLINKNFSENYKNNIVLIDDVFTTGATMNECCKILKKSGFKKVWGFTLARTP